MQSSLLLAKVFGLFSLLGGVYMLIRKEDITRILERFAANKAIIRAGGFTEIGAGLFIVLGHPVFVGWPTIITILGIASLAEGLFYLFASHDRVKHTYQSFLDSDMYHVFALLALALGAYLTYAGFAF
ncbi:MAG: hypothetical protein BRC24_02150 [Parcubacteria group bacterium SW_4_46_8]|nr:MAG: hypothetical protein BRC24_02150 [Parcubacteria group bacterium SW_4_46_8]